MVAESNTLPPLVREWAVKSVHPEAEAVSIRPLQGGTSSLLHIVAIRSNGVTRDYVVRLFTNAEWLAEEPDAARHEAHNLQFAYRNGLPAPIIVACDETGNECGIPAVLMTMLDGQVNLHPSDVNPWLNGLAESLTRVHAIEAAGYPWTYFSYKKKEELEVPAWSTVPDLWRQAVDIVRGERPRFDPCLIHRDYHAANVLWSGGAVSGIVDWANACSGPAAVDVGHCRRGVEASDAFLEAYIRYAGDRFRYDPYWDLVSLFDIMFGPPTVYAGWAAFGVTGLTDTLMERRLDEYLASMMRRLS